MGAVFSQLYEVFSKFGTKCPSRILLLGLDAAGKTTLLCKLKLNEVVTTIPTIGFNVEEVHPTKNISFTVWDVGGQEKIRQLWRHYYQNSHGLMFIVDCADQTRFSEAREELFGILDHEDMKGVPVEILANKQDLPGAASVSEVIEGLHLRKLSGHKWHVQSTCALSGDGVYEAIDQLAAMVKDFKRSAAKYT